MLLNKERKRLSKIIYDISKKELEIISNSPIISNSIFLPSVHLA